MESYSNGFLVKQILPIIFVSCNQFASVIISSQLFKPTLKACLVSCNSIVLFPPGEASGMQEPGKRSFLDPKVSEFVPCLFSFGHYFFPLVSIS